MNTKSKDKTEKAQMLYDLIQQRKVIEKAESDLKAFFKDQITDGVLVAGDIVITLEARTRTGFDRKALEIKLGIEIKDFETTTEYTQMNVVKKAA